MKSFGQLNFESRFLLNLPLATILLGSLWVRVNGIGEYFYNSDEMNFLIIAKGETLNEVWRRGLAELHPPLAHFIRHFLLMLTPEVFYQRLFSVAAGIVSIIGMYRVGLQLRSKYLGLYCASCIAFLPVSVSISITIRNYAFFMAFLSWAFYFFLQYQMREKKSDLLKFTVLLFLASATHFTGFLVGGAFGLADGWRLASTKQWKKFNFLCISFLPLFCLGLFFYFHFLAPGTAGPMFNRLVIETGFAPGNFVGRLRDTILGIFAYFDPLMGIVGVNSDVSLFFLIFSALFFFFIYAKGFISLSHENPATSKLLIGLWCIAIFAALANFYPFSPNRHNYYFLPFFILPIGFEFENIVHRTHHQRFVNFLLVLITVLAIFFLKKNNIYLKYDSEFVLKQNDLIAGQNFLERHLTPKDVIVTERISAYFYFPYYKDAGKTPYDNYADVPYYHQTTVLAPFDPPFKPHFSWKPFHENLNSRLHSTITTPENKVWFVMYGWENTEIRHLLNCDAIRPEINDYFSRDDVLIFSIMVKDMFKFLNNAVAWKFCYADYKPLISAKKIKAYSGIANIFQEAPE